MPKINENLEDEEEEKLIYSDDEDEFIPIDPDKYHKEFIENKKKYGVEDVKYTEIPKNFIIQYNDLMTSMLTKDLSGKSNSNPIIFSWYYFGKRARLHQAYLIHLFLKYLKEGNLMMAACIARQLGKTTQVILLIIWLCWYNKFPVTIANITACFVTSRDDDTSKELIEKIRLIFYEGNKNMEKYSNSENYFTGSLKEPNNSHQITFLNNCFIKSIPPTMTGIGKSASFFLIDEAHRLNSTDISPDDFFDISSPMVAETGGGTFLSSSPQGQIGFFYDAIDPEEKDDENEFITLWMPFFAWNDGTKKCQQYHAYVEKRRKRAERLGRLKFWQQEYLALFTVTETAFFDHSDIDDNLEDVPNLYEYQDTPCSTAYDYGMKNARTVITVRTKIKDRVTKEEIVRQIFQWRSPADFDINKLTDPKFEHSIQNLKKRYPIFMVIADDCPAGDTTNRKLAKDTSFEFKKYNFRSDQMSKKDGINRNCLAYSYRAGIKSGLVKIPKWNKIQQFEMKTVQEVEQKVLISIKAPQGQLCDTFDSDIMACLPFLDMQNIRDFEVDVTYDKFAGDDEVPRGNPRHDPTGFKKLTDEQCRELLQDANDGLIRGWD